MRTNWFGHLNLSPLGYDLGSLVCSSHLLALESYLKDNMIRLHLKLGFSKNTFKIQLFKLKFKSYVIIRVGDDKNFVQPDPKNLVLHYEFFLDSMVIAKKLGQ